MKTNMKMKSELIRIFGCLALIGGAAWAGAARDVQVKEALCEGPTVRSFDLTVSAGEAMTLYAAHGPYDAGADIEDWPLVDAVRELPASAAESTVRFDLPAHPDAYYRFFLCTLEAPPFKKQLAFLKADGTQYFTLGTYCPDQNCRVEADVSFDSYTSGSQGYWGARQSAGARSCLALYDTNNSYLRFDWANTVLPTVGTDVFDHKRHKILVSRSEGVVVDNGACVRGVDQAGFTSPCPMMLFAFNNNGTATLPSKMTLWRFKVWTNAADPASLIYDLVPCVKDDDTVTLYNLADKTFLPVTSGTFTYDEADVVPPSVGEFTTFGRTDAQKTERLDRTAFDFCADITFKGYAGVELADFPALVKVGPASIDGFRYDSCAADGGDIAFADADGNILACDLDEWNADSGEDSVFWVKVPKLGPSTKITVYWSGASAGVGRSAAAVWSNQVGVWHMGETSVAGAVTDCRNSTAAGSALDAFPLGAQSSEDSISVAGIAGRARSAARNLGQLHDERLSCVVVPNAEAYINCGSTFTISGWFRETDTDTAPPFPSRLISRKKAYSTGTTGWEVALVSGDTTKIDVFGAKQTSMRTDAAPASFDLVRGWMHVFVVYNGTTIETYLNGEKVSTSLYNAMQPAPAGVTFAAASDMISGIFFGMMAAQCHCFVGDMDEIRMADIKTDGDIPTAARVKADYDTVASADFTSYSAARKTRAINLRDYGRQATITFKGYGEGTLRYLPTLVKVGPRSIQGFKYSQCAADGSDIVFVGADGCYLPCELDEWNAATGEDSLFWVQIPELKPSTAISVCWQADGSAAVGRSAAAVWSGYAGVWHCAEARGDCRNSTSCGAALDAQPVGAHAATDCVGTNGIVGTARQLLDFNAPYPADSTKGHQSFLSVRNYDALAIGGAFAYSGWYRTTGPHGTSAARLVSRKSKVTGSNSGWEMTLNDGSTTSIIVYGKTKEGSVTVSSSVDAPFDFTDWTQVFAVFNGKALDVYLNGKLAYSTDSAFAGATDSGLDLWIGGLNINGTQPAYGFIGDVDEFRLMPLEAMTPDALRVRAEYEMVAAPDFAVYSPARSRGGMMILVH